MTQTQNPDVIPFGTGPEYRVRTYVTSPDDPEFGEYRDLLVARGTLGVNIGSYSWNFDAAERLALDILAACRAGREWQQATGLGPAARPS